MQGKNMSKTDRVKKADWKGANMSQKTRSSDYSHPVERQGNVRKSDIRRAVSLDEKRLFLNLGHLVSRCSIDGKVAAYTQIADQLSELAGMRDGRSWSWRYVASVHSGTIVPGKKFVRVLTLLLSGLNQNKKQWFYYTRRRSVAAVYDKSMFKERINEQMKGLGFRSTNYSRYMRVKSAATHKKGV